MLESIILYTNPSTNVSRLVMSTPTRWNSTFLMLSRLKSLETEVRISHCDKILMKDYKLEPFSDTDWDKIDVLLELLQEFFLETVEIEGSKKITINFTTCSYMYLYNRCDEEENIEKN